MEFTKIINLTPHSLTLKVHSFGLSTDEECQYEDVELWDDTLVIPPSGTIARCDTVRASVDTLNINMVNESKQMYIPVNSVSFGAITGLPDPQDGVVYVVSSIVAQAAMRADVLMVDDTIRNDEGQIIGARALGRVPT